MVFFLIFGVFYVGAIFVCSLFIVGWYGITRGEKNVKSDGSVEKRGKIFMEWHFFFDRKKRVYNHSKTLNLKEEERYIWPHWIRAPLSECIHCMSSVYGTAFYWGVLWLLGWHKVYSWSVHPLAALFIGWVIFCICVSAMNPIIFKKTV
jgi:hypothetical protein